METIIDQKQKDEITRVAMERQTSLTAPADMVETTKFNITPSLICSELKAASDILVTPFFRPVERKYIDPPISQQVYCVHSFVPSKCASPDKDGIYGMIKCRGTYNTLEEANQKAEELIKKVDSIHKYHINKVGHPFPMTLDSKFASEKKEVDLKEKCDKTMEVDFKEQTNENKKEISEIKQREELLLKEVKIDDPLEKYVTTRVRRANLVWTYVENIKKLRDVFKNIKKAEKEIEEQDGKNPEFRKEYIDRFNHARRESGLNVRNDETFMKYLDLTDVDLPVISP
jgi:hypothetical protein